MTDLGKNSTTKNCCSNGVCCNGNGTNKEPVIATSDSEHPRNLIPLLLRRFYKLGWCSGTGGGISIRRG